MLTTTEALDDVLLQPEADTEADAVSVEDGELEDPEEEVDTAPPLAADILQAEAPSQHVARADRAGGLEGSTFDSGKWWSERWTDEARKAKSDRMKKYWEDNQDR